jgi:hypothetical protein
MKMPLDFNTALPYCLLMTNNRWNDRRIGAQMARNNRPHTAAEIADTRRRVAAGEQVNRERLARWPIVTAENFDEVNAWQNARLAELEQAAAADDARRAELNAGHRRFYAQPKGGTR